MTTKTKKKAISEKDFNKKVEIESANLQHYNHLPKDEADKEAKKYVSERFHIV